MKNVIHVDTSSFALKTNLASLKTEVDKLDIDKLAPVPVDLSKLSAVVKNDTCDFVIKTNYQTDKTELEKKIPYVTDFVKKAKLTELENKIPDVSSLAIKTALTAVEKKISSVNNFVKKKTITQKLLNLKEKLTDHNHHKYITAPKFITLASNVFNARLAQANLITNTDFDVKLSSLNKKITENKSKNLLAENELNKLKTFDSSYFIRKSHFEEDGTQNYLVFQPLNKYFKVIANTDYVSSWKSKGLSAETIKPPTTSDISLTPAVSYYGIKMRVKLSGSCSKQPNISYTHWKVVNIYIVYKLGASSSHNNDATLKNCLFGKVTLTTNADIDKCGYCSYGIW